MPQRRRSDRSAILVAMGTPITRDHLLKLRLAHHFPMNDDGATAGVVGTVRRMLAMQAQEFGQALWAIGSRAPDASRTDVLAVLDSADVVRSYPIRGTLHFVRPGDLRWMLSLTAERMIRSAARRLGELELDQYTLDRARDLALEVLAGGMALERNDFLDTLNRAGISTANQRGYHIIWYLAQKGIICWGPPQGTQQALVLLDEWAPEADQPDREEALRRFVLGYFTGHGPATVQDFVWWSKLTVADAKRGLALARSELTEYAYDGASYWASPAVAEAQQVQDGLLLAGYDEYVLGYADRSPTLPVEYASRIMVSNNGVFRATLVLDSRVVGTWRKNTSARTAVIEPFAESGISDTRIFDSAIRAHDRFLAS